MISPLRLSTKYVARELEKKEDKQGQAQATHVRTHCCTASVDLSGAVSRPSKAPTD